MQSDEAPGAQGRPQGIVPIKPVNLQSSIGAIPCGRPDVLFQMLSTMMVLVNALQVFSAATEDRSTLDMHALRGGLATLEQMTRELLYEIRSSSDDAPLPELEGVTLAEALSQAVEGMAETLGLSSRVQFSGEERALPRPTERLLYYIAREALYQAQQRTGVRKLRLSLNYGRDEVLLTIEDDGLAPGRGEESAATPPPLFNTSNEELSAPPFTATSGATYTIPVMSGLRHRVVHLGGSLEVNTPGEQGTRLQARVPYIYPAAGTSPAPPVPSPVEQPTTPVAPRVGVLVVDSQAVTRAGLRRLLESYADLHVVGAAADGVQAVSETLELGPQVVLMDMQLPNGQSLEALRQIKQLNLDTHVLLLSAQDREELLYETLRAGADGYVLKDIAPDELAQAVRAVARGEILVRAPTRSRIPSRGAHIEALTAREEEVLRLLARGLRNKEIAARLFVSERTVNFHLANIYQKLNVSGRTEALSKALEQGLITA